MFTPFVIPIVCHGALAANYEFHYKVCFPFTIEEISAKTSNAGSTRIKVGTNSDDDEFLTYTDVGTTIVQIGDDTDDWRYDVKPHLETGDVLEITVDYDGASGTAGEDLVLVVTCTPG